MKTNKTLKAILTALLLCTGLSGARADTFGSGANTFTIDFVKIANPGNGDDLGAGGGYQPEMLNQVQIHHTSHESESELALGPSGNN